jgi:hypothetical protein
VAHILLWAPWPYSKTKQIIFSAQNSNDIDGRCSESNLVSFLRGKINTSQMLMAFAQMLIACNQRVRAALERHPLPPSLAATTTAEEARRAFLALFADDAARAATLRADLAAHTARRRRAVVRAVARLPRSSSV